MPGKHRPPSSNLLRQTYWAHPLLLARDHFSLLLLSRRVPQLVHLHPQEALRLPPLSLTLSARCPHLRRFSRGLRPFAVEGDFSASQS